MRGMLDNKCKMCFTLKFHSFGLKMLLTFKKSRPLLLSTMCLLVERFHELFESLRIGVFSFYSISTRMASLIYLLKTSASVQNFTLESFWSVKRFVLLRVSFVNMKLQDKLCGVTVCSGTVLFKTRAQCIVLHGTFLN